MDQRKQNGRVVFQRLPQFRRFRRTRLIIFRDKFSAEEIFINLKSKISVTFPFDLSRQHNHRITFAGPLRMPENAEFSMQIFTIQKRRERIVHAKKLIIFGDNFYASPIIQNKILNIVQQRLRSTETVDKIFQTDAFLPDSLSIRVFLFIVHFQPLKEKLVTGVKSAKSCLRRVGKNTNLIIREQKRYVFQIVFQINIIGVFDRDIAVF